MNFNLIDVPMSGRFTVFLTHVECRMQYELYGQYSRVITTQGIEGVCVYIYYSSTGIQTQNIEGVCTFTIVLLGFKPKTLRVCVHLLQYYWDSNPKH